MAAARKIRKIFSTLILTRLSSTTLSSLTLLHLTLLTAFTTSCTIQTNSSRQSSLAPPQIESATIENDRLIIHGTFLQNVTTISIEGIPQSFAIESQSDSQIQAYVASALKLVAGKSYNVVVASAYAQASAPITLQLDSLGAENGQVLQFNSVTQTWEPGDLNGLTFLGSWDASNNSPELHDGGISTNPRPGDYYIVTTEGNTLLDGIDSWAKGDWVVYRSDGIWTKIVSHGGVTSFNGRMGTIAPQTGDYALSNLSDVDTSGKTTNSVLKWDGVKWVVDTDDTVASTGVITGTPSSLGDVIFHSGTGDSSTEQMRMTSTGLGIGTSSPKSRLTVEGDMTLDQLTTSPTGTSGYGSIYAKTDGKLYFRDGTGSEFDLTSDSTKLPLIGGTLLGDLNMEGDLNMGGNNILGTGHLTLSPGTTINLGTYDNASETTLTSSLTGVDKGKAWFNTTTNEIRYWNGSLAKSLGVAGAGLQSLGGESGGSQSLAVSTTGPALNWSSASDTHTLNIPMASTAGVTAGLLSKTDYDTFSGKLNKNGDAMSGTLNMSTYKITNLGTPTVNADAATKSYVDANLGGSPLDLTGLSAGQAVKWDATNSKWILYTPTTGTALTSGNLSQFASTTSSQLSSVISDETGSGALVFATSPTLSSPALTGEPTAPTAPQSTNTTQIATTEFVLGQASLSAPSSDGTASSGSSLLFARSDHVHPTDTSRSPASGSTSIITLGTIGTGTWQGSTIDVAYGGTGSATGSITGSGALTFTAGGVGTNVTLTPGTGGSVILNGGLLLPDAGTPGSGKILTSDASGVATWQTAFLGDLSFGSSASSPNNAVYVNDSGNVGIGTNTPEAKLSIFGPTAFTTQTFNYTGGPQTFVVPAGVTSVNVVAYGAKGASASKSGGNGGKVTGVLNVTPGEILNIYVGSTAGYNGGGSGNGGGGGASDIRQGGTELTNRVIVAGGGGGSGNGSTGENGGSGGGSSGGGGSCCGGGTGGTQVAGGSGGSGWMGQTGGSLGVGGNGGGCGYNGGGGGGGYFGGGGGYCSNGTGSGGGGGGSSLVPTGGSTTAGVNSGNGYIVISTDDALYVSGNSIFNDGNVGIGTSTPGEKLEVAGTIHSTSGGVKFPDGTVQTTAVSGALTPTGGIIMYSGAWAFDGTGLGTGSLAGWALCNGNNSTPNLTDRFVLAASASGELGATGGSSSYSLVESQLPSHTHTFTTNTAGAHTHTVGIYFPGYMAGSGSQGSLAAAGGPTATSSAGDHSHSGTTASTGSGSAIDNRPAFVRLAYIMKLP